MKIVESGVKDNKSKHDLCLNQPAYPWNMSVSHDEQFLLLSQCFKLNSIIIIIISSATDLVHVGMSELIICNPSLHFIAYLSSSELFNLQ